MLNKKDILEKEIDLIQSCINRMAQNSFIIKGWTVSLIAVVLALLPESVDIKLLCILGVLATFCFWYLDAYFLKMERLYRWKYEWVIKNRLSSDEYFFDLNPTNSNMWNLDENNKTRQVPCILKVMFTKTLMPIYLTLIALSLIVFIIKIL